MKICPNGHEVSDVAKFCPKCGAEIQESVAEEVRFCKKCGNERKGTEKFCSHCGNPFNGDSIINSDNSNEGGIIHSFSSNKKTRYLLIIVPILLFGVFFINNHIQEQKRLEKARLEENERVAEERKRVAEEERRKGVEKIVTLSFTRTEQSSDRNLIYSGSYGAIVTRSPNVYVATDYIPIPKGKIWIYERMKITKGDPAKVSLWYYSRESGALGNRLGSFDSDYILREGGLPILRPGDGFRISFVPFSNAGTKSIEVILREKDEDLYY